MIVPEFAVTGQFGGGWQIAASELAVSGHA